MKIILKKDIIKLGEAGELVDVKPGYAFNYLIPRHLALVATPSVLKQHEETIRQRAHKEAKLMEAAEAAAKLISSLLVKIPAKVSNRGRIYGSITTARLAEALEAAGVDGADKKNITITSPEVKEPGIYDAEYKCYKEVKGEFKFEVVPEGGALEEETVDVGAEEVAE